ncbi:MAG: DEAD/DEAH box helicase [Alphaproteobacteria bacterium]
MSFEDFGLSKEILQAIEESGYTVPTPIQAQAIPVALMGRDILGSAQTGTGKTASFTLPMIEALSTGRSRARMPRALILEPTRELAAQVADNFEKYGKHLKLTHALLIGGEFMSEQLKTLERGVDVLIATPGRLIDMFERGKIMMSDVKIFVIDEADRMLDMGFIPDVEKIASKLPALRQTMLFSATMPPEIKRLADQFLMNPKLISVAPPASPAETVEQQKVICTPRGKQSALRKVLLGEDIANAIIFCNRKRDVDMLLKSLKSHDFSAAALHGDMVQFKRMETLDLFKKNEVQILVASDVAARGLDIVTVSHVFNYDVPFQPDDYIHRIGRTGRAGRSGKSFTFVTEDDAKSMSAIERLIKREVPIFEVPDAAPKKAAPKDAEAITPADDDIVRPRRKRRSSSKTAETVAEGEVSAVEEESKTEQTERAPARRSRSRRTKEAATETPAVEQPVAAEAVVAEVAAEPVVEQRQEPVERAERAPRPSRSSERRPSRSSEPRDQPRRSRGSNPRTENPADIPGPQSFGEDNTPAFLLRPTRKQAASG